MNVLKPSKDIDFPKLKNKNKKEENYYIYIVDVKGWCHVQRNCSLIWKHNLNKSTHISLNP